MSGGNTSVPLKLLLMCYMLKIILNCGMGFLFLRMYFNSRTVGKSSLIIDSKSIYRCSHLVSLLVFLTAV